MAVDLGLAPNGRTGWIDCTRGFAIVALVLYHVVFGMVDAGLLSPSAYVGWGPVGELVRMPLMMFVAGLFVTHSLRKGTRTYFSGKARRILWPFLVWTTIYMLLRIVIPGTNNPLEWSDLAGMLWAPRSHTWFLRNLMIYYAAIWLLMRWGLGAAFAVALIMAVHVPLLLSPEVIEAGADEFTALFLPFVAGIAMRQVIDHRPLKIGLAPALAVMAVGFSLPQIATDALGYVKYTPLAAPISLIGVAAAVILVALIARVEALRRPLSFCGRYSLQIYLTHVIAASGTRIVLDRALGIETVWVVLPVTVVVALMGPVAVALLVERWRVPFIFEWPRFGTPRPAMARPAPAQPLARLDDGTAVARPAAGR